jgi:hypothetical protein
MRRPLHQFFRTPECGADYPLRINAASPQRHASGCPLAAVRPGYEPSTVPLLSASRQAVADHIPLTGKLIEIHLAESKQLFNAIDPAPFREKDLDPKAEEFIVDWARELPANAPLTLVVRLDQRTGLPDEAQVLREAISQYFGMRSQASRQRLKRLFKLGRISLLIGMLFLAVSFGLGEIIENALKGQRIGQLLRESLAIGGWVAMWRPLEIFLYDWWPIRLDRKLYDRLSAMPVRVTYASSRPATDGGSARGTPPLSTGGQ